jgi:hypothetical protein
MFLLIYYKNHYNRCSTSGLVLRLTFFHIPAKKIWKTLPCLKVRTKKPNPSVKCSIYEVMMPQEPDHLESSC